MPRAIAHPRDDILPETLPVKVLDMGSLLAAPQGPRSYRPYVGTVGGLHEGFGVPTKHHPGRTADPLLVIRLVGHSTSSGIQTPPSVNGQSSVSGRPPLLGMAYETQ